jgi:exopolyphosphatase/guanosine-5'-triphosphate,3'-diphosphate pyrophosphatase
MSRADRWAAAIDCGTNAVRMLVARPGSDGRAVEVSRLVELTRLGEGVDETGRFAPAALQRTLAVVDRYADVLRGYPEVGAVRFAATSAARDVSNRDEFFAGVRQRLGVTPEVIAGTEEAELSFRGAVAAHRVIEPVLVVDVGGGSTELVVGGLDGIEQAVSLDVGCVRLKERFIPSDPPTPEEVGAAREYTEELLAGSGIDFDRVASWISVGGTATTLACVEQRLPVYDRSLVDGSFLTVEQLRGLTGLLCRSTAEEVMALGDVHPVRADVTGPGALISAAIAERVGLPMRVSEADILDGMVARLLAAA